MFKNYSSLSSVVLSLSVFQKLHLQKLPNALVLLIITSSSSSGEKERERVRESQRESERESQREREKDREKERKCRRRNWKNHLLEEKNERET